MIISLQKSYVGWLYFEIFRSSTRIIELCNLPSGSNNQNKNKTVQTTFIGHSSSKLHLIWISFDRELKDLTVLHNLIIILFKSKRIAIPTVMSAIWKITNTSSQAIPDELSWYLVNSRSFWVYSKFLSYRPLVLESSKGEISLIFWSNKKLSSEERTYIRAHLLCLQTLKILQRSYSRRRHCSSAGRFITLIFFIVFYCRNNW